MPDHTPESAALYLAERGYLAEGGGKRRGKHPPTADTIRRMIYAGRLTARRFSGRAWAISQDALDELLIHYAPPIT